jgi:hypothetical protein
MTKNGFKNLKFHCLKNNISFMAMKPSTWVRIHNTFLFTTHEWPNNLECLHPASLSRLALCLQARPEPTRVKHITGR